MIRAATASLLAMLLAVPALAQESGQSSQGATDRDRTAESAQTGQEGGEQSQYITAEMIEDARIVSLEGEYDPSAWESDEPLHPILAGLAEIGDVEEILLDDSGRMQGVTTDIGGFIGIGEKTVMIPLSDMRLARSPDDADITIVTRLDREQLEQAPEFEAVDD